MNQPIKLIKKIPKVSKPTNKKTQIKNFGDLCNKKQNVPSPFLYLNYFFQELTVREIISIGNTGDYTTTTLTTTPQTVTIRPLNDQVTIPNSVDCKERPNKDDNIHKSEALKLQDKRTLALVECQKEKAEYKSLNKIVRKFVVKVLNYRILFNLHFQDLIIEMI